MRTKLTKSFLVLILTAISIVNLSSCRQSSSDISSPTSSSPIVSQTDSSPVVKKLWSEQFDNANWQKKWAIRPEKSWGLANLEIITDPSGRFEHVMRINYPQGSATPSISRKDNVPIGGSQFYADLGIAPHESLRLSYYLRFADDFDFVKGGKLPGLFGGNGASGGNIPDGTDGFSTRFMWRRNGDGEVYAYLPTSKDYGTSIGRGNWQFQPGIWHHLEQEIKLNSPGQANGQIKVWLDGVQVLDIEGITFRYVDSLKIDGIFFSTFFGGGDSSWATPKDTHIDFAEFSIGI